MRLKIDSIWSPNLRPEESGLPPDIHQFHLYMKVKISDQVNHFKVFDFQVCSPTALSDSESGAFLKHILVMEVFDWDLIKSRIKILLEECNQCATWEDAVKKMAGSLEYRG